MRTGDSELPVMARPCRDRRSPSPILTLQPLARLQKAVFLHVEDLPKFPLAKRDVKFRLSTVSKPLLIKVEEKSTFYESNKSMYKWL